MSTPCQPQARAAWLQGDASPMQALPAKLQERSRYYAFWDWAKTNERDLYLWKPGWTTRPKLSPSVEASDGSDALQPFLKTMQIAVNHPGAMVAS